MASYRKLTLAVAAMLLAVGTGISGCTPSAPPVDTSKDAERNRAVTQQGLNGAGGPVSPTPGADRNTSTTQSGLGAAGVPNPNPQGSGGK